MLGFHQFLPEEREQEDVKVASLVSEDLSTRNRWPLRSTILVTIISATNVRNPRKPPKQVPPDVVFKVSLGKQEPVTTPRLRERTFEPSYIRRSHDGTIIYRAVLKIPVEESSLALVRKRKEDVADIAEETDFDRKVIEPNPGDLDWERVLPTPLVIEAMDLSDNAQIGTCHLSPSTLLRMAEHGNEDTFVLRGRRSNGEEVSVYPRASTPLDDPCGMRVPSITLKVALDVEPIDSLLGVRIVSASSRFEDRSPSAKHPYFKKISVAAELFDARVQPGGRGERHHCLDTGANARLPHWDGQMLFNPLSPGSRSDYLRLSVRAATRAEVLETQKIVARARRGSGLGEMLETGGSPTPAGGSDWLLARLPSAGAAAEEDEKNKEGAEHVIEHHEICHATARFREILGLRGRERVWLTVTDTRKKKLIGETGQPTKILVEMYYKPYIPAGHGTVGGNQNQDDIHFHFSLLRHVQNKAVGLEYGTGTISAEFVKIYNLPPGETPKSLKMQEWTRRPQVWSKKQKRRWEEDEDEEYEEEREEEEEDYDSDSTAEEEEEAKKAREAAEEEERERNRLSLWHPHTWLLAVSDAVSAPFSGGGEEAPAAPDSSEPSGVMAGAAWMQGLWQGEEEEALCFIGVHLCIDEARRVFVVKKILDGGPAHLAGKVRPDDAIIGVNGKAIEDREDFERMTTGDAIKWWTKHFLGKPGTEVTVTFQRKKKAPFTLSLVRANVLKENQQTLLQSQKGAVDAIDELDECHDNTQKRIQKGLHEIMQAGPPDQRCATETEHDRIWGSLEAAQKDFEHSMKELRSHRGGAAPRR